MNTISLCMIVRDEEQTLERCLCSAAPIADEIVLVDTGSVDRTVEIAKHYTDRIHFFDWIDDFAAARNFSFAQATGRFCLWLDADDVLPEASVRELRRLKREMPSDTDVVMMPYHVAFDEEGRPALTCFRERMVRRAAGLRWTGAVHEVIAPQGKILYSTAVVEHRKQKPAEPGRNLRIFEKLLQSGRKLDARQRFYYARELLGAGETARAAALFEELIDSGEGWTPNRVEACMQLSACCRALGRRSEALSALLRALELGAPRAELCCQLGDWFLADNRPETAAFWYRTALTRPADDAEGGFVCPDCRGYIPLMQLCVCCDRMGDRRQAARYNELAGRLRPNSQAYLHNVRVFQGGEQPGT